MKLASERMFPGQCGGYRCLAFRNVLQLQWAATIADATRARFTSPTGLPRGSTTRSPERRHERRFQYVLDLGFALHHRAVGDASGCHRCHDRVDLYYAAARSLPHEVGYVIVRGAHDNVWLLPWLELLRRPAG